MIKRRETILTSKYPRSSKRFPKLRSIQIPAETWPSSQNPRKYSLQEKKVNGFEGVTENYKSKIWTSKLN